MLGALDLVTLLVQDLDASRGFYGGVLQLECLKDANGYVEYDSGGWRLALYSRRALADLLHRSELDGSWEERAPRLDLSFRVGTEEEVDLVFEIVSKRGAEVVCRPQTMPWGHRAAFIRDPDGNLIEIVGA